MSRILAETGVGHSGFEPVRVIELEIGRPLNDVLPAISHAGRPYARALALVKLHGAPLGLVELPLDAHEPLRGADCARAIRQALGRRIDDHLAADGLAADDLGEGEPPCARERRLFLARAPSIAVIVPTRERPAQLRRCLDSILKSSYPRERLDVVVVDNAPLTDAVEQVVAEHSGAPVRYLREDVPGSASARNTGLAHVTSDLVAFTDDDVVVDRHWLAELARGFDAVPGVACVSGLVIPLELETPAQLWFEEYGGFGRGFERRLFDLGEHRAAEPLYPYSAGLFGTGNNFAFRRSTLAAIGNFDPALGNGTPALGGVDSEVLLRTILSGHRILYEPSALVHHLHRREYEGLRRQVYSYGAGLTAYLLKTLIANPRLIGDFAAKLPRGLAFALDPHSEKNATKRPDYPRELTRLELRGMLYGPIAYARSRRRLGPHVPGRAPAAPG